MGSLKLLVKFSLALILIWYSPVTQLASCRPAIATKNHVVQAGTWGGDHAILEATDKSADVEFDCAHGRIPQPLTLDKNGSFDWSGTFTGEHSGPARNDENSNATSVRYTGHADGKTMFLKFPATARHSGLGNNVSISNVMPASCGETSAVEDNMEIK